MIIILAVGTPLPGCLIKNGTDLYFFPTLPLWPALKVLLAPKDLMDVMALKALNFKVPVQMSARMSAVLHLLKYTFLLFLFNKADGNPQYRT